VPHWSYWFSWITSDFFTHFGFLLALVFLANLLRQKRSPSSTVAWLLVILLLPYIGVPLYLLLGGRKMGRMARKKERIYDRPSEPIADQHAGPIGRLLSSYGVPAARAGNRIELVTSGTVAFERLLSLVDQARSSIYITTYILGSDAGSQELIDRLTRRAGEGIAVRVLIDSVGSWRLRRRSLSALVSAGGEVKFFMPVFHVPFRGRANLRNHRKIVVVDGRVALTGGMNLAWPYIGPRSLGGQWVDFSVVVEGPSVADLEDVFWSDWKFATGRDHDLARVARPLATATLGGMESSMVQVVASGPDVAGDPLYESLLALIFAAEERIWIVTPYFVPDEMLIRALTLASRRGVDVRLIVPERSNHITTDLARAGYLRDLTSSRAHVLYYTPVMLHAKVLVFDDRLAIIGSANMDMRSLFLNYEVSLFISSPAPVAEVLAWMRALMVQTVPGLPRRGLVHEISENIVRLLSPLL
jgi:cardiolipin synthase